MKHVEFFFDVGSPYTYLAYHQLPGFEICGLVTRSPESRATDKDQVSGHRRRLQ